LVLINVAIKRQYASVLSNKR